MEVKATVMGQCLGSVVNSYKVSMVEQNQLHCLRRYSSACTLPEFGSSVPVALPVVLQVLGDIEMDPHMEGSEQCFPYWILSEGRGHISGYFKVCGYGILL